MVTTPRYASTSQDPGSVVVIGSPRRDATTKPPGIETLATTTVVAVVTASASCSRESGAPTWVATAYADPEPRAASTPSVAPDPSTPPPLKLTRPSPTRAATMVRTCARTGARP